MAFRIGIRQFAVLAIVPLLAGCFGGPEEFSVRIERPVERVYSEFTQLPAKGSLLRQIGVSGIKVELQKPADGQLLFVIPASDGREGSQLMLSFSATPEGGTLIDAKVFVPELAVSSMGNQVIDDDKIAEELRRQMNRMGEAIENSQPVGEAARDFNLVLDTVAVLSDPALLARVERKADLGEGILAMAGAADFNDANRDIDHAARNGEAMSDPDEDAYQAESQAMYDQTGDGY